MKATIHVGNCVEVLKGFAENSMMPSFVIPPMRSTSCQSPSTEQAWLTTLLRGRNAYASSNREVLLGVRSDRTHHRMVCAVEDAGFDIRGNVVYMFGSGFPKNLSVSKAIDREAGATQKVVGRRKLRHSRTLALLKSLPMQHMAKTHGRENGDITAP